MNWKTIPADPICAALTIGGHYCISHHSSTRFVVSWRPFGQHVHVAVGATLDEAQAAAERHAAHDPAALKRAAAIGAGKVWQVYPDDAPDEIVFEGSKTACRDYQRHTYKGRRALTLGKLLWENLEAANV